MNGEIQQASNIVISARKSLYENKENNMVYNYSISDDVYALTSIENQTEPTVIDYAISLDYGSLNKYNIPYDNHKARQLKKEDYYDANNIILDHYVRDIAEYLKYLFFLLLAFLT